ncbi:hypothetical protein FACS1894159_10570 [Bacteroidia bacterium]|nr:hypothetical protein FACS1894159_10570 [Bacteroidia bacterium]
MTHDLNRAKVCGFLSKAFCSLMIATAIVSFASCDSRKKINVQEFESNFRAVVAIEKCKPRLPVSFAFQNDPYGSAKRAIEIFNEEITKGNQVSYSNALCVSTTFGKKYLGKGYFDRNSWREWRYVSKNGILCREAPPQGPLTVYEGPFAVLFNDVIKEDECKKDFQTAYGIDEDFVKYLGDLSDFELTNKFFEAYENTALSLTKPEVVSESESAIIHKVKDINSGYVFYVTQEWSADGATSKKSFKFENENKKDNESPFR